MTKKEFKKKCKAEKTKSYQYTLAGGNPCYGWFYSRNGCYAA